MGFYQPDAISGFHMAAMMLVGLLQRQKTGRGEAIDLSMFELAIAHIGETILAAQLEPGEAAASANRDADMSPNGTFPCAGEDRWIAISVPDDLGWEAIKGMPGFPDSLHASAFATLDGRRRNEDLLETLLGEWTARWEARALMMELQARGVPAGVVLRWAEAVKDPHLVARDWFLNIDHPDIGVRAYNGFAWRFASCALKVKAPPPRLGEDSELILRERLSLSPAEIADLKARDLTGAVF